MTDEIRKRLQQIQERGTSLDRELDSLQLFKEKDPNQLQQQQSKNETRKIELNNNNTKQQDQHHHDEQFDKDFYARKGVDDFLFNQKKQLRDKIIDVSSNLMFLRRQLMMTTALDEVEVKQKEKEDKETAEKKEEEKQKEVAVK